MARFSPRDGKVARQIKAALKTTTLRLIGTPVA